MGLDYLPSSKQAKESQFKPGPEMDALTALALGWTIQEDSAGNHDWFDAKNTYQCWATKGLPPFSTDPGEAIKALEEFCKKNEYTASMWIGHQINGCTIYKGYPKPILAIKDVWDSTLEQVICLAIVEAAKKKENESGIECT